MDVWIANMDTSALQNQLYPIDARFIWDTIYNLRIFETPSNCVREEIPLRELSVLHHI